MIEFIDDYTYANSSFINKVIELISNNYELEEKPPIKADSF